MPPQTILIVYDVPGWAYHHQALAMEKFAPAGFELSLRASYHVSIEHVLGESPPDLIFCHCSPRITEIRCFINNYGWHSKLVGYWSLGWPCRIEGFNMVYDNCDLLICNNKEYTTRVGPRERLVSISNGVDLSIFHASNRPEDRDEKIIWVGSEYHRIIKGYDHFILPLFSKLQQKGLTCEARLVDSYGSNNASLQEMAEWYNTGTVLVCASEAEGTPNPVLEAAACGCAIVSTPVGNVPELVRDGINGYIVDRQLDSLLEGVLRACCHRRRLARQMSFDIRSWHWEFRVGRYYEEFRRVLEADPRPGSGEAASGGGASA